MKKKGFTLVELLAVIVILAIISVISVPIILGVIETARKESAKSSAYLYMNAIELYIVKQNLVVQEDITDEGDIVVLSDSLPKSNVTFMAYDNSDIKATFMESEINRADFKLVPGKYYLNKDTTIDSAVYPAINNVVEVKGDKPTGSEDYIVLNDNYEIDTAVMTINNYEMNIQGGEVVSIVGDDDVYDAYAASDIVYLDPTDLNKKCNSSNSSVETGKKSGCMKWYVITTDDTSSKNNVKLILAHNTRAVVPYNSSNDNSNASEINARIAEDTTGWDGSLNPGLISVDEIRAITGNTTFTTENLSNSNYFYYLNTNTNVFTTDYIDKGTNKYAWLFDYTDNCQLYGCNEVDSSTMGYWTNTSVPITENINDLKNHVWGIYYQGNIAVANASLSEYLGIRPVITVDKKYINSSEKYNQVKVTGPYNYYNIGTKLTLIDGSKWYVIEGSSSADDTVKLISEYNVKNSATIGESMGSDMFTTELSEFAIAYDQNGSNSWSTSSLKSYLNSTVKSKIEAGLGINIDEVGLLDVYEMETLGLYKNGELNLQYERMVDFIREATTWLSIPYKRSEETKYMYVLSENTSIAEVTQQERIGARIVISVPKTVISN